jgi:hypothetical protein
MSPRNITRSEFLRDGSCLAAGALLVNLATPGAAASAEPACQPATANTDPGTAHPGMTLRPYQLLCLICSLGEHDVPPQDGELNEALQTIRKTPDTPLTLCCNAGDVYVYQDPGTADDTPEGRDFNRKRDLDILQRMNWPPGVTLPARTAIMCLMKQVPTVAGICGYDTVTSAAWPGCSKAHSGCYEKGLQKGIAALVPPRTEAEMVREKEKSIQALNSAQQVTIRPHILLCAVCQYGGGLRPPYKADNLPELVDLILHKNPDVMITMARQADWMMCAPCPSRAAELNACVNVLGSGGLSNEKRDLDLLQKLGLEFGSTLKARELFRLIFEKVPSTQEICRRNNPCPSVWWDGCGESNLKQGNSDYEKGRRELMDQFARLEASDRGGQTSRS